MTQIVANDVNAGNYRDIIDSLSENTSRRLSHQAERRIATHDTYYLGLHVLGYDWMDSRFHPALCKFIDDHWNEIQMHLHPRGHLKTTVITITTTVRRILLDPNHAQGICANTDENAKKMLWGVKTHFINNEKFRELFPEHAVLDKSSEGTTEHFTTPARTKHWITEASVEAFSVRKAAVSRHYAHIIFDDLQDANNSRTKARRDEVYRVFGETLNLLNPDSDGRILYTLVGTRWSHDDVYGRFLKSMKRDGIKVPLLITEAEDLALKDAGKPRKLLFPERRSPEYLDNMFSQMDNPYTFYCQLHNRPIRDEDKDFFSEDVQLFDGEPEMAEGPTNRYMLMDPGGWTEKAGIIDRDCCVIAVYDVDTEGHIWMRQIYRGVWNPDEQQDKFFEAYRKWRPMRDGIGVEAVAWQKALCFYINRRKEREGLNFTVQEIKRGVASKQDRIRRIGGYLSNRQIHAPRDGEFTKNFLSELDEFPTGKDDDILDTLADCVEIMNVPRVPVKRRKQFRRPGRVYETGRQFGTGYGYAARWQTS